MAIIRVAIPAMPWRDRIRVIRDVICGRSFTFLIHADEITVTREPESKPEGTP